MPRKSRLWFMLRNWFRPTQKSHCYQALLPVSERKKKVFPFLTFDHLTTPIQGLTGFLFNPHSLKSLKHHHIFALTISFFFPFFWAQIHSFPSKHIHRHFNFFHRLDLSVASLKLASFGERAWFCVKRMMIPERSCRTASGWCQEAKAAMRQSPGWQ